MGICFNAFNRRRWDNTYITFDCTHNIYCWSGWTMNRLTYRTDNGEYTGMPNSIEIRTALEKIIKK